MEIIPLELRAKTLNTIVNNCDSYEELFTHASSPSTIYSHDFTTSYCCVHPKVDFPTVATNIYQDPYFVFDFVLHGASPCVDEGNNSHIPVDTVDYYGGARIDGTIIDIGADEND